MPMQTWLITGGVACGKSAALSLLARNLGPEPPFCCDRAAAALLEDPQMLDRLSRRFGASVLQCGAEGRAVLDRIALRELVFGDPQARLWLEQQTHPLVLAALESARLRAASDPSQQVFLAEVPLYYEIGACVPADLVIVVASSPTVQIRRLMEQRGLNESTSHRILRSQLPIADKVAHADVVLWNDGIPQALEAQINTLLLPSATRGRSILSPSS